MLWKKWKHSNNDSRYNGYKMVQAHGIGGNVLQWIGNWLSGRKQRVILRGQVSDWCSILSGVPQGSVLGPLLFVIYINDIDEVVNSKLLKFADDTKIFDKVNSVEEVENLRTDLRSLVSWSKEWQMLFNLDKCTWGLITLMLIILWMQFRYKRCMRKKTGGNCK